MAVGRSMVLTYRKRVDLITCSLPETIEFRKWSSIPTAVMIILIHDHEKDPLVEKRMHRLV